MKKVLFGIFAHPDDEAFGPSGTLLMETEAGTELHLISLTLGDAGTNPDNVPDLAAVRQEEWHRAGELMGARSQQHLGYKDGTLCNLDMIEAGTKLVAIVQEYVASAPDDIEVEFMTSDLNGISGHIDHIVAARAASWAFHTLKANDTRLSRIRYACIPNEWLPEPNVNWLYMEAGRRAEEIDEVIDARDHRDEIIEIMRAHHSQRGDGETHIKNRGERLGLNHFIVRT